MSLGQAAISKPTGFSFKSRLAVWAILAGLVSFIANSAVANPTLVPVVGVLGYRANLSERYTCNTLFTEGYSSGGSNSSTYTASFFRIKGLLTPSLFFYFGAIGNNVTCDSSSGNLSFTVPSTLAGGIRFAVSTLSSCNTTWTGCSPNFASMVNNATTMNRICAELGYTSGTLTNLSTNTYQRASWNGSIWSWAASGQIGLNFTCTP